MASGSRNASFNLYSDLLKGLWEAAVRLRGSIEPADYKRYVLPIIFLRFLSLRYENRHRELEELLEDPESGYYTTDAKARSSILEDPDEYRSAGAFIVPVEARWDSILKAARQDDFKAYLDDTLQRVEDTYPDKLRGLLPRIYAGSNLAVEDLRSLINVFSSDVFQEAHDGTDLIGKVYEYFIGQFANSEGKRGGEYFTPASIVKTLVAMLEPTEGVVFDPCCGSGGMFVQSDVFTGHSHRLSFVGQESKDFTYRLARMNLFIHGIDGNVQLGNSYFDDKHASLRADFVIANPPFNDGAKSKEGWGAGRIPSNDPRLVLGTERVQLSPRNANSMWMLHFFHHLKPGGLAGFVMANGELNITELARHRLRRRLVEGGYVDCIVQLSGQLFANTQIPCALWFLSRRAGDSATDNGRQGNVLFIDGRGLGKLIPGSRTQKALSDEEVERIAACYRVFKSDGECDAVPGFCRVVPLDEIRAHDYGLSAARYVGSEEVDGSDGVEEIPTLLEELAEQVAESQRVDTELDRVVAKLRHSTQ